MIRGIGRGVIAFGLVIVTLILLASMWVFGWGFFSRATADFRGETAQIEDTLADPDYRIAAYDHFFGLCTAVQNTEAQIRGQEGELEAEGVTEARKGQIQSNLAALRASRESLINEYNNDAGREATVGQFHASNLPDRLDSEKEKTECVAPSDG